MLFIEMCVNHSFIFSVSALTVFQSWFLKDRNVVFFSDIIFFIISTFIFFSSCVSLYSVRLGCVAFRLVLLCVSVRLDGYYFSVFSVWIIVLGSCWLDSQFICWCISNISRSINKPFFIIVLTWSASLWLVVLNLAHSSQISLCWVAPKITVKCKFVIFLSLFSMLVFDFCGCLVHSFVPKKKKRTANIRRMPVTTPSWLSREYLPIMTPKPVMFRFVIFIMGSILLFITCALVTDVTKYSLSKRTLKRI